MKITFLGWGSLIPDRRNLRIKGSWKTDGPFLPIEFARISRGKKLTLVLYPDASDIQTLWAYAAEMDLQQAIENLRERENIPPKYIESIGFVSIPDNRSRCNVVPNATNRIRSWAIGKKLDAVVWTDLPSNFPEKTCMKINEDNIIKYLKSLHGEELKRAKDYIEKVPPQIKTKIRRKIEQELGWVYISNNRS